MAESANKQVSLDQTGKTLHEFHQLFRAGQAKGAKAVSLVPRLRDCLASPERGQVEEAVLDLGFVGPAAQDAVPNLVRLLSTAPSGLRPLVIRTLGLIGSGAADALPALRKIAGGLNPALKLLAQTAVQQIEQN